MKNMSTLPGILAAFAHNSNPPIPFGFPRARPRVLPTVAACVLQIHTQVIPEETACGAGVGGSTLEVRVMKNVSHDA
jgi:hypothetical protein